MDREQRMTGRSAAWGVLAIAFAGGSIAMWALVVKPGSVLALSLAWIFAALAAPAAYLAFAYAFGWRPAISESDRKASIGPAPEVRPVPDVGLTSEQVDNHTRLVLENHGPETEFLLQVISNYGPMGQRTAPQNWTIRWHEDGSTAPKRLLKGARQTLDFARYDDEAVEAELATGHGSGDHWKFSAAPDPIGARYYNLFRREDLEVQFFTLIVRIMNARSGDYMDRKIVVRVQQGRPVCEIIPLDMSGISQDRDIIADKS
jgi:hypothetical protein